MMSLTPPPMTPRGTQVASVTFDQVTKRYGDVTAVDRLDLDIVDGEFMVLLGPSGCGKTTALRMIAGLEDITEGKLSIGDSIVNDVEPSDRDISMVFQSYALYPHLTVAKNIESPLQVRKVLIDGADKPARKLTKTERADRIAEAARILGLEPYLDRKPKALSGGQRQRVALARAIVGRPQAFLMDEPLSNLDAKLRAQTRIELVDLQKRLSTTTIYVTHDQVEAMTMAHRIAVMADGRLQQVGTPEEVYAAPANLFVAGFIGTPPMNILEGQLDSDDGQPVVVAGDLRLPIAATSGDRVESGRKVEIGIRPEQLSIGDGPMAATVTAVEWLGHESLVAFDLGGHRVVVRGESAASLPAVGEQCRLAVDPAHIHLFDAETTERL